MTRVAVPPPAPTPYLPAHSCAGSVGLELEVGTELAGAELAQVGAIDEDHLLGFQLVPLPRRLWARPGAVGVPIGSGPTLWRKPGRKVTEKGRGTGQGRGHFTREGLLGPSASLLLLDSPPPWAQCVRWHSRPCIHA